MSMSGGWASVIRMAFRNGYRRRGANTTGLPSGPTKLGGRRPSTASPMNVNGTPAAAAAASKAGADLGVRRGEKLIVVAAGRRNFEQAGIGGDRRARGLRQRQAKDRHAGADPRNVEHLCQIADEAVRDVHAAARVGGHRADQLEARLGRQIPLEQERLVGLRNVGPAPLPDPQADRRIADRAGDIEAIAGLNARCGGPSALRGTEPIAVTLSISGPGVATVSPPISGQS